MIAFGALLHRLAADLREAGAASAVVGGLAVSARTEPRFTRDADLAVAVGSDAQSERTVAALIERGYRTVMSVEQEAVGRLDSVRLVPAESAADESAAVADLLFASCGIEPEIVAAADTLELIRGLRMPVARVGHLIAMKVLSANASRPQDAADLQALAAVASPQDFATAAESVRLITRRGFNRGRDLSRALRRLRSRGGAG